MAKVREIPLELRNSRNPLWAPDGRTFVMSGINREDKRGIYEIDVQTGAVSTVVQSEEGGFFMHPVYSPDGRKIYFSGRRNAPESGKWTVRGGSAVEGDSASCTGWQTRGS